MIRIFKQFKAAEWLLFSAMAAVLVVQCYFDLTIPEYTSRIINLITPRANAQLTDTAPLFQVGLEMIGFCVASISLLILAGFLSSVLGARVGRLLRQKVFYKALSFSMEEMGSFSTSSLMTRTTNDVQQITMSITMGFRFMIKAPIMAVMASIKAVRLSQSMSLVTLGAVAALVVFVICMAVFVAPMFKKVQKLTDRLNAVTRENLTGLRVVRAYNAEGIQQEKFESANQSLTKTNKFVTRANAMMDPFMVLVLNGTSLATYWVGAFLLNKGSVSDVGMINEFLMYSIQVITSFIFLVAIFLLLPRAAVSARRIGEVLDTELRIADGQGAEPTNRGTVTLDNVSFRYPGAEDNVLSDVSFTANKGETVAIIGSTGSGKSTLAKLIVRLIDVTEGSVSVGGMDVRRYTRSQLCGMIGYVPQRGVLFSGDVKSNILYGDTDATEEQMVEAAKTAMADEFISKRADGYNSPISQGGTNVSGGQKQRISIARAIAKDPDIMVFDDSFSALDYKTDRQLRQGLQGGKATLIIVAQRIGTIKNADRIVVLDKGRVVGIGTHDKLLKDCKVYHEIAVSQLSKEELN